VRYGYACTNSLVSITVAIPGINGEKDTMHRVVKHDDSDNRLIGWAREETNLNLLQCQRWSIVDHHDAYPGHFRDALNKQWSNSNALGTSEVTGPGLFQLPTFTLQNNCKMHLICASVVAVCFVLEFLCIVMIRRHGPMTQACEATDQVSEILSFDSSCITVSCLTYPVLCHWMVLVPQE
jgi:hypothetical protein